MSTMGTLGLYVLCAALIFTGNAAPVEKRRESTKEILQLESLLKKSAGEDKQVFPSQLRKEAKAKEAKLAAEAEAREAEDEGVDLPPVPPEMQVDGLADRDELEAQLKQQHAAQEHQKKEEAAEQSTDDDDSESTNEEETVEEDTEDEPETMDAVEKREQELFMRYLRESPELWQQLMDSLEYGNAEADEGRYPTPEDEYPAVMEEWRAAADTNQNYVPQNGYESDLAQQAETEDELENELPRSPQEFNNLEELQEYYSDKVAEENAKKLGYGRPDWVDQAQVENTQSEPETEEEETDSEHAAQKRSPSVQDHLIM